MPYRDIWSFTEDIEDLSYVYLLQNTHEGENSDATIAGTDFDPFGCEY
jgi:hypothetical protein